MLKIEIIAFISYNPPTMIAFSNPGDRTPAHCRREGRDLYRAHSLRDAARDEHTPRRCSTDTLVAKECPRHTHCETLPIYLNFCPLESGVICLIGASVDCTEHLLDLAICALFYPYSNVMIPNK
jgi:hypothetical protein